MTITIELTAEQLFEAAQQLPAHEQTRLRELLSPENGDGANNGAALPNDANGPNYRSDWSDEDLADAQRATGLLIEKRFGTEPYNYD